MEDEFERRISDSIIRNKSGSKVRQVASYKVVLEVGSGSFGKVYEVEEIDFNNSTIK